jgi:hypothetical protein
MIAGGITTGDGRRHRTAAKIEFTTLATEYQTQFLYRPDKKILASIALIKSLNEPARHLSAKIKVGSSFSKKG